MVFRDSKYLKGGAAELAQGQKEETRKLLRSQWDQKEHSMRSWETRV